MTRNQYNNVIQWTLSQCSGSSGDSLLVSREIFRNLGVPFPNGDYTEVLRTMMSGVYMGWCICTIEQAAQCADQGIPAVGLSTSRVIVVMPEEAEEVVINKAEAEIASETIGIALPAGEIAVDERMDMQFFAFAEIENQNLAAVGGAVRIAGRTGGSGGNYYSAPRYVRTNDGDGVHLRYNTSASAGYEVKIPEYGIVIMQNARSVYAEGYEWIKVRYYRTNTLKTEDHLLGKKYEGWIPVNYTAPVSMNIPRKSNVTSTLNKNLRGNQLEMLTNARYVHRYLRFQPSTYIWTNNAIYAMLGNMIEESSINPNYWEGGQTNSETAGYGLTQWTKPSKYFNWLKIKNRSPKEDIDHQLSRIIYEVSITKITDLGEYPQWQPEKHKQPMSFMSFTESNMSVEILSEYFLRCYEQPGEVNTKVSQRQRLAIMCKDWIEQF